MKKLLSLVSLISLVWGLGLGMPASAQPLTFTSDTTISFTGSGRTLIIKSGSSAQTMTVGILNMVVTFEAGNAFRVWDTGTDATTGNFRKISSSDLTQSTCASGNAASEITIMAPSAARTVTIAPSDELFSCTIAAPVAGGGTVSTTTSSTTPTVEQQKAAEEAAKAAAEKKAAEEKAAQEKTAEQSIQPVTVKTVDVAVTETKKVEEVAISVKAADLGVSKVETTNLQVKKTGEASKEILGEKPTVEKQIKAALEKDARDDAAKKTLNDVQSAMSLGSVKPVASSTVVESFAVTDKTSGKSVSVSKVSQTIVAKETLQNVKILVTVPKDVAKSASELVFPGLKPKIIQDDPIIEWEIAELKAGEKAELAYQVNKKVESIDSKVIAVASTPLPKETVFIFKDGKFVSVSKEEAAKIEAEKAVVAKAPAAKEEKLIVKEPEKALPPEAISPQVVNAARQKQVDSITNNEAPALAQADTIADVVKNLGIARDEKKEDAVIEKIIPKVDIDLTSLITPLAKPEAGKVAISAEALERIVGFVAYGTEATRIGEGERAGVLNSYIAACGKVPKTEKEWADVLKIAAGRFPTEKCAKTLSRAQTNFQRVYRRTPKADNASDQAALTMMQYGLLPVKAVKTDDGAKIVPNRDVAKENKAITVFRSVFKFSPKAPTAWSVVRAIAYSGAKR